MLCSVRNLYDYNHYVIHAKDGEVGRLEDIFFDDEKWGVRYLVVGTGGWFSHKQVLISPIAIHRFDMQKTTIDLYLNRRQVENSPELSHDMPVSRQNETEYFNFFGWPYYWAGPDLWGMGAYPSPLPNSIPASTQMAAAPQSALTHWPQKKADPHLRSAKAMSDFSVQATNGSAGILEDFILEGPTWALRYLVINMESWWPTAQSSVLITPEHVQDISWTEKKLYVDLPQENVRNSPKFYPYVSVNRDPEGHSFDYYGRAVHWSTSDTGKGSLPL